MDISEKKKYFRVHITFIHRILQVKIYNELFYIREKNIFSEGLRANGQGRTNDKIIKLST